ncbi:unnamed protein product [Blepharisma stoltei]|uniref:Cytochrome b5 heme-binding domain-containing protein n=1 Tax=Blepharisma stoltei TaxID=1481888 RepID=A0AAU9KGY8_9CILI|nr:unnamed protein product [Blepharisma stoltei]
MKVLVCLALSLCALSFAAEKLRLTREQLKEYDGTNGKTYLACGGIIFDVSESPSYAKGGGYSMFAGRDASVSLAKMSFDKKLLDMTVEEAELTEGQKESIEGWVEFYTEKYPIVGELVTSQHREDI